MSTAARDVGSGRARAHAVLCCLAAALGAALAGLVIGLPAPPPARAALPPLPLPSVAGQWGPVMDWPLVAIHSVLLPTGRVMTMDGWEAPNTVQVFDPGTSSFSQVNNDLGLDLFCSAQTTLADGRLIVVGGHGDTELGIDDTSIFDPATNLWSAGPKMHSARWYANVVKLGDGRLVAISGNETESQWADTPEVYDPAKNTWTELPNIQTSQVHESEYPLSFALPSGKIFTIATSKAQAYLMDPDAQTWNAVGGATLFNGTAAMYRPGKIVYSGGGTPQDSTNPAETAAQVIDLASSNPTWQPTGSMNAARYAHTLTVLPDGRVLAVGGGGTMTKSDTAHGELSSEEWDPNTGAWTTLASMNIPRLYHSTALLMPDARVLVAGGGHEDNDSSASGEYSAQYFSPPYLFLGPRPAISSAPSTLAYGSTAKITTPDAALIGSVALVSLGADTHTLDMNQHFVPLSFSRGQGSLQVQIPAASSASTAPPGYYMLFIVNALGVPSVAPIVKVADQAPAIGGSPPPPEAGSVSAPPAAPGPVAGSSTSVTGAVAGSASSSGSTRRTAGADGTFDPGLSARCTSPAGCTVTAIATASIPSGSDGSSVGSMRLVHRTLHLAGGRRTSIRLRLSRGGLRLLRRLGRLRVAVTVTLTARGRHRAARTRTITLRPPGT